MKLSDYPEDLQRYAQAVDAALTAATGQPRVESDLPQNRKIYYPQPDGHPTILLNTVGPQEAIGVNPDLTRGFILAAKKVEGQVAATPHIVISWLDGYMLALFYQDGSDDDPAYLVNLTNDPGALETTVLPWVTLLVESSRMGQLPSG